MANFLRRLFGGSVHTPTTGDSASAGLSEEHLELRRAIERCDSLRPAHDAGQLTVDDLVETLARNNFSKAIVRKAIAECFGEDVAKRIR